MSAKGERPFGLFTNKLQTPTWLDFVRRLMGKNKWRFRRRDMMVRPVKSAFKKQEKSQKDGCSWLDPPVISVVSYATAGVKGLYTQVTSQELVLDNDTGAYTDENGVFCPKVNMPLLARRYCFQETLGRGGSSITIRSRDTFRSDGYQVAIKILNVNYYRLGYQESSSLQRLNKADPNNFSGTLRLLNIFSFSGHFCMVFELLHPKPLHHYFKEISDSCQKLKWIRKVAVRLLQVLGFLQKENVIHADLKPENVLCKSDDLSSGVKVIDFGNAIHCVYDELSLYYDDFELQTLLYRAPEVLFGLPFGLEIDMWSLGCILAELYIGQPLFFALSKDKLLQRMVSVLGPMPAHTLQRGKFFQEYSLFTGKPQSSLETWAKLHTEMIGVRDPHFISFIAAILQYNPSDRLSVYDAFQHPFLAPEIATRYLLPSSQSGEKNVYPKVGISSQTYNLSPAVSVNISNNHLKGIDLLRHQTKTTSNMKLQYRGRSKSTDRVIAEVAPFVNQSQIRQSEDPAFPVEQNSSSREAPRIPAFQIPPMNDQYRSSREVSIPIPTGQRNVLCYANDVRKPIAVPGEFANSLMLGRRHEKDLSNRVLDVYARYQCSPQASQSNTDGQSKSVEVSNETHNQVDNQAFCEFQELPSTSHKGFQELPSTSKKGFQSGLGSSKRTAFSCRRNFRKVKTKVSNKVLQSSGKQTKDDVNECVDGSLESQNIVGQSTDERKLSDSFGRDLKGGVCMMDTPVQHSEVLLTSLSESNSTTSEDVRSDTRHGSVKMRTKMLNISNAEFEDTNCLQQSLKGRRRNILGIDKGVVSQSNKCKDVTSPLSRWGNLEQMRTEALRKNKIDVQSKTHNTQIKSKLDGTRVFSVKTKKQKSSATFSQQKQVLSMTKQRRVLLSPSTSRVSPRSCTHSVDNKPFSKRQRSSQSSSGVSPGFHCSSKDVGSTKPFSKSQSVLTYVSGVYPGFHSPLKDTVGINPSSKRQRVSLSPSRISPKLCSHSLDPVGTKTSSKQIKVSVSPSGVAHGFHCPSQDPVGTKVSLSLSEVSSGFYSLLKDLDGTKPSSKGQRFSQSASEVSPAFNIPLKNLSDLKLTSKRQKVSRSSSRLSPGCHSASKDPVDTKPSSKKQRDSQSSSGLSSGFQSHSKKSVGTKSSSNKIRDPVGTKVSVSPSEASSGFHSLLKDPVGTKLSSKGQRVSRLSPSLHSPSKDQVDTNVWLSPRQASSRFQRPSTNPVDTEPSSKRRIVSQSSSGKSTKSHSLSKKPVGIKSFSKNVKISLSASGVSTRFHSPSKDQINSKPSSSLSTPSNLATSIAQLKSVTYVSPTEYKVLLLSEFPTPVNQTVTPSTACVQSPMSDNVNQNVAKLDKLAGKISVSDEDSSESEGLWQEVSLHNKEEDFLEDEVLLL